ncbi:MAG: Stage II sporulation protein M [Oscillospiraceae bacterium]|jgi:stage II sporulation protein M
MSMSKIIVVARGIRNRSASCRHDMMKAARLNWELVMLAIVFLAGMFMGAIYARHADIHALERLDFLFAGNFKARMTEPLISIFTASFASAFLFVFICFLCGLSIWGMFLIPFIPFFRGFGLGLTAGYLYACYGGRGVLFTLTVILPGAYFCCLAILLAARNGIVFSHLLASVNSHKVNHTKLKIYILQFGIVLSIVFLASLIDLLLSVCLGGLFSF